MLAQEIAQVGLAIGILKMKLLSRLEWDASFAPVTWIFVSALN
jgi:hypothetical protein